MSRRKEYPDVFSARFPAGTADAIDRVLMTGETPAEFLRAAVTAELERRRRKTRRLSKPAAAEAGEVAIRAVPAESVDWCARVPPLEKTEG